MTTVCNACVQPVGGYGLPACLRITIGLEEQMQQIIDVLGEWKGPQNE